jgi:3-oxoacyl-ACP reductase-like protein
MASTSALEKGEELPLKEPGAALGVGHSRALGKYTSGLVSRMVDGKMPGGFNITSIKAHLSKAWVLGPSQSDGILLLDTTMEPAKCLGSEAEAKAWLDTVVTAYAQRSGISLSVGGAAGGSGGGYQGAVINSEEFIKFQADQEQLAAQHIELYMRYLKRDSRSGDIAFDKEKANSAELQAKLDGIAKEHGDTYIEGIQPVFDPLKARRFDSWNWVRQDALVMYYDIIFSRLTTVDWETTAQCLSLLNRADPDLLTYMQYNIDQCDASKGNTYHLEKQQLIAHATPRNRRSSSQFLCPQISGITPISADKVPLLHLKRKVGTSWEYSSNLTSVYLNIVHEIATSGTIFKDKNALLTSVGKGSIGVKILKGLLSEGAHIVITTSRYDRSTVQYYRSIYHWQLRFRFDSCSIQPGFKARCRGPHRLHLRHTRYGSRLHSTLRCHSREWS